MSRARRLALVPVTFLAVALIAFLLIELVPGDPAAMHLGAGSSAAARVALHHALGLQGGVAERLVHYLGHLARLELGTAFSDGRPVSAKIAERLPVTLALALTSLLVSWMIALPLALRSALRSRGARTLEVVLGILYATPVPALALALLALGAPYGASFGAIVAAAVCLAPLLVPRVHAHAVRALEESLGADASRTLRSVGATRGRVVRAALRAAALRLVTLAAVQLPALLSGAVLVEAIFGLPGLGLLAFDAMAARDQPVLMGLVLVGAGISIGATALVDVIAPALDPRLRAEHR